MQIEEINAVTLGSRDISRSLAFYHALGFATAWAAPDNSFVVLRAGRSFLNLVRVGPDTTFTWWGRVILHVDNVDVAYATAVAAGLTPEFEPRDAPWGERYFQILDPDGHDLSFARRL